MKIEERPNPIVLLKGTISCLERTRRSHNFALTDVQHRQISATVIATSAMGIGSAGMGLMGMTGNSDEEADWVEFKLGENQLKGWLWMMPMRNGDNVEVVAEQTSEDEYVIFAVKRDGDDLLAIYPHATSGRKVHYRKSAKAWLWSSSLLTLGTALFFVLPRGLDALLKIEMQLFLLGTSTLFMLIFAVICFRVSQRLMGFVKIAEAIFRTFGWPNIENIDLRQTSIENRRENNLPNYGTYYFRYK